MSTDFLRARLRVLGLLTLADDFDDIVALATTKRWGPAQLLEHVADVEDKERARRGVERRLSRSHLGKYKPIADFDWEWPTKIDRSLVEAAVDLGFLGGGTRNIVPRNIILVGPQGVGKSMIAQNIAHQAILAGHSVLFTTAAQMLLDLGGQESSRSLERRLQHYAKANLLVLDEVGYLAFDNRNADLLFQVVSRRYERKSLVLTTNLAFKEWPTIFPNATCATALIDRVVHHADVISIEGKSYRLREAEGAATERKETPKAKPKTKK